MGKFILVVLLFAALVYALMWALERRRAGGAPRRPIQRKPQTKQIPPDDDEDFLRGLNRKPRPDKGPPAE